jgi:hypothetical protein
MTHRDHDHRHDDPHDQEPEAAPMPQRRDFLKGLTAVAAMVVSGGAVVHTTEAWGLEATSLTPDTMRTLVKVARDIFPHDKIPDKFYALAVKSYDEKSAKDPKLKGVIDAGIVRLDKLAKEKYGVPYAAVGWEAQRVALLKAVQTGPFFKKVRGDLVVSLYNQKAVWPMFGYEGESSSKGGYIARGFDDIKWI